METVTSPSTVNWLNQVIIRHLTPGDLPGLEWEGEYIHFRRIYADAYQRMVHGLSVIWVADLPGTGLVGQALVQLICDRPELADGSTRGYVYAFRVRRQFRSHGLGSRIMHMVEDDLVKRGYEKVTLNVAKDNPRARELYERLGYRAVAHEPGIWSYQDHLGAWRQVNEPAWRMEKALRP
jgi:ribosomal protein S18 acetylase RimI-like enzyme